MVKTFSKNERKISEVLSPGTTFLYKNERYTVTLVAKPYVNKGECKTDIFLEAQKQNGEKKEFKISYKQENAQFIENKVQADRAEALLGSEWKSIITNGTLSLKDKFEQRPIIFKSGKQNGSITLGWKYELLDSKSGDLSSKLSLTEEQVKKIYSGDNLPQDKKDATVKLSQDNKKVIKDSGIANFMLRTDDLSNAQNIINSLQTIDEYVNLHPDVYFACKALNYQSFKNKFDGDRALSVLINWHDKDNQLVPEFVYDNPLVRKGKEMADELIITMQKLGIENTNDITINYEYSVNQKKE